MKAREGWPYLVAAGVSLGVLLLFVVVIVARERRPQEAVALPVGKAAAVAEFPEDFGRLDELVPFAGGVSPVPVDVVPVSHAPEFQEAAWVNAQDANAFTLQVLAARDEEVVKRFLADREDRGDFAYFLFPQPDGQWYVLTTGRYPSHELAASVAESKDFGSLATRPFPRRIGVYQDALKTAAASAPAPVPAPVPVPAVPSAPASP